MAYAGQAVVTDCNHQHPTHQEAPMPHDHGLPNDLCVTDGPHPCIRGSRAHLDVCPVDA